MYYDYGGSHTSITAACIHAGKLNPNKLPTRDDLMEMPFLDKTTARDFGKIKYIGNDKQGNEIYSLGIKASKAGLLLEDLVSLHGIADQYLLQSTSPYVNNILRIGGWLSRSLSLPAMGRPLVINGLRKAYPALCSLVGVISLKQKGIQ